MNRKKVPEPLSHSWKGLILKHGVMPIIPNAGSHLGRIQVFPIPTVFGNLKDDTEAIARIPASKIAAAQWLWLKNQIRIKLGMSPAIR